MYYRSLLALMIILFLGKSYNVLYTSVILRSAFSTLTVHTALKWRSDCMEFKVSTFSQDLSHLDGSGEEAIIQVYWCEDGWMFQTTAHRCEGQSIFGPPSFQIITMLAQGHLKTTVGWPKRALWATYTGVLLKKSTFQLYLFIHNIISNHDPDGNIVGAVGTVAKAIFST